MAATATSPSYADLQSLVDRAAHFHARVVPAGEPGTPRPGIAGLRVSGAVHRMTIQQEAPEQGRMSARAITSEQAATIDGRIGFVDDDYIARPGREPDAVPWNIEGAQRLVLPEAVVRFQSGAGLRLFGAGRVFPVFDGERTRYMAGLVADVVSGDGEFTGVTGNCTWCGDLGNNGFDGHIMFRLLDPRRRFTQRGEISPVAAALPPEAGVSYKTWLGQKTPEPRLDNSFSIAPGGVPRGLNIPVDLKLVHTGWQDSSQGFRVAPLETGPVIGLEIGFGKESLPRTASNGVPAAPYQFEGVSKYTFSDASNRTVATLTANVLEGRSMNVVIEDASGQPGLRFGFFGPVLCGTGSLANPIGMLYGCSGSILNPPPLQHVISNWYTLRLYEPAAKAGPR